MPWRYRFGLVGIVFVAVLVAAWVYIPDFQAGVSALWGDGRKEAAARLK